MQTASMATNVDENVASIIGRKTSDGLAAPICARYIMIVIGIRVNPEALMQRNIIIGLLAESFSVFSSCSCCIAFSPIGVAALSSPSRLAEILADSAARVSPPFANLHNSQPE